MRFIIVALALMAMFSTASVDDGSGSMGNMGKVLYGSYGSTSPGDGYVASGSDSYKMYASGATYFRDEFSHDDGSGSGTHVHMENYDHEDTSNVDLKAADKMCFDVPNSIFEADNPFQSCTEMAGILGCDFPLGDTYTVALLCCKTCKDPPPQCGDWNDVLARVEDVPTDTCEEFAMQGYCSKVPEPNTFDFSNVCCDTCSRTPKDTCMDDSADICASQEVFYGAEDCGGDMSDGTEYFPVHLNDCQEDDGGYHAYRCERPGVVVEDYFYDSECSSIIEDESDHVVYNTCIDDSDRRRRRQRRQLLGLKTPELRLGQTEDEEEHHAMLKVKWTGACVPENEVVEHVCEFDYCLDHCLLYRDCAEEEYADRHPQFCDQTPQLCEVRCMGCLEDPKIMEALEAAAMDEYNEGINGSDEIGSGNDSEPGTLHVFSLTHGSSCQDVEFNSLDCPSLLFGMQHSDWAPTHCDSSMYTQDFCGMDDVDHTAVEEDVRSTFAENCDNTQSLVYNIGCSEMMESGSGSHMESGSFFMDSCFSHDECGSGSFCFEYHCSDCHECHYCHDGVDGNCGECSPTSGENCFDLGSDHGHHDDHEMHGDEVLCPGQPANNFCDGDGDCFDHPDWCSCSEAQALCARKGSDEGHNASPDDGNLGSGHDHEMHGDEVLCPGQPRQNFCDGDEDCYEQPDWCSCPEAQALCARNGGSGFGGERNCNECVMEFAAAGGCEMLHEENVNEEELPIPDGCHHCGDQALAECGVDLGSDHGHDHEMHGDEVLCPGQPADNFCDGDGDCVDHPDWCSCSEAQALCGRGSGFGGERNCNECVMDFMSAGGCEMLHEENVNEEALPIPDGCYHCGDQALTACGVHLGSDHHHHEGSSSDDDMEGDEVLCPGQPADNFCDGDGDCLDHPDWCSCSEAQALCARNFGSDHGRNGSDEGSESNPCCSSGWQDDNGTCMDMCPGQCPIGMTADGCQLCMCAANSVSPNGSDAYDGSSSYGSLYGSLQYDYGSGSSYFDGGYGSTSYGSYGSSSDGSSPGQHGDGTFMRDEFPEDDERSINNLEEEDLSPVPTDKPKLCFELPSSFFAPTNPFQSCEEYIGHVGCDHQMDIGGGNTMSTSEVCCTTCKNPPPQCSDWDGVMSRLTDVGVANCQEYAEEGYCTRVIPPGEPDLTKVCCATCATVPKDGCGPLESNQVCAHQEVFWGADDCNGVSDGTEYFAATIGECEMHDDDGEVWYEKVDCSEPGVFTYNEYLDSECTVLAEGYEEEYVHGSCVLDERDENGSSEDEESGSGSTSGIESAVGDIRYSRRNLRGRRRRSQELPHVTHAMVRLGWEGVCQPGSGETQENESEDHENNGDEVLCPGQPADNFCDGDGDCVDNPDWCSCSEAQALCKKRGVPTKRPVHMGNVQRVRWSNPMPWLNIEYTGQEQSVGAAKEESSTTTTTSHRWFYGAIFLAGLVMIPIYHKHNQRKVLEESMEKLLQDCEEI